MDLECEGDAVSFTSYYKGDVGEMTIQWLIRGFVIKLSQMMDRSMMTRSLCFPGREILGDISHQAGLPLGSLQTIIYTAILGYWLEWETQVMLIQI